jgi:hypothetical protein
MRLLCTTALLASLCGSATAAAQNADVLQQDVAVDLTDSDDLRIQIDLVVEATGPTGELWFPRPLVPNMVASVDGVAALAGPHPSYPNELMTIKYPTPLTAGQQVDVSIALSGAETCGGSTAFCFHGSDETIFTAPQPGSAWFYNNLLESDPFVGTVTVLAPSAFTVVAGQGAPSTIDTEGANRRWHFDITTPTELLGLYAGQADEMSVEGDVPVTAIYHADQHDEDDVALAVEVAAELLPIYAEQYGPLPVDHAYLIAVPSSFAAGGMGHLGKVFFNSVVFSSHDYLVEQGAAHELAHSWWGNLASGFLDNESYFLGEGLAEYSAWRGLGTSRGAEVRTAGMRMNAVWYQYRRPNDVDVPILAVNVASSPAYVYATYHKGALVMRALESTVGAEPFGRAMKRFAARGYGQLSMQGLIDDVLTEGDYDASDFVDQWMRRTGYPYIIVTPTIDGAEVELAIEVFGDYLLDLPVRFTLADGTIIDEKIVAGTGVTQHSFTLAERPASVSVDPDWTMPREVAAHWNADVNHDAIVDAADLIDVALRAGTFLPEQRRVDGGYDPLFDLDRDREVGDLDLAAVHDAAML